MSSKFFNVSPFLRTSRNFPMDAQPLSVELTRSYIDIANAVNFRTIGLFPTTKPVVTGEQWFVNKDQKQQTFRQVYNLPPLVAAHNIQNFSSIAFTRIYGTAFDGNIWYPLPYVESNGNANNQIKLRVDSTQYHVDRGSSAPAINTGFLILEWLSNP